MDIHEAAEVATWMKIVITFLKDPAHTRKIIYEKIIKLL